MNRIASPSRDLAAGLIEEQQSQDRLAGITPPHSSGVLHLDLRDSDPGYPRVRHPGTLAEGGPGYPA